MSVIVLGANAQKLSAVKSEIDCGEVKFRNPISVTFEVKNEGRGSINITDVRTSCGCVSVDYPKDAITNNKAMITVMFDAAQMGHFEKEIGIYNNKSKEPLMLKLVGEVVEKVAIVAADYPFEMGSMRVDKNDIEFDDINRGDILTKEIRIANMGSKAIEPTVMHLPNYISADVQPSSIAPRSEGIITIKLDSRSLRNFGLTQTTINLGMYPGDKVSENNEIGVSAVLLPTPNSNGTTTQNAPKIKLSDTELNIGELNTVQNTASKLLDKLKLKKGWVGNYVDKKTGTITIENIGKSRLDISRVQIFTSGLSVSLSKTKLEPGEIAKLKVKANPEELSKSRRRPRVLMITNDPEQPKIVIVVNVE